MDFHETSEQSAFRHSVREFVSANLPTGWRGLTGTAREEATRRFYAALAERRWGAPAWPIEYGGPGLTYYEQFILNEEMAKARAPVAPGGVGIPAVGPAIMFHGSEEQKKRYLPRILDGTDHWCQGLSEPGAGSDLAGILTRAARDGDNFIINGQKLWTSGAQVATMCYLMARTDPDAPKHRGLSIFLVDMKTPGINVQPITMVEGEGRTCEVFWDNVVVPASALMGELNRGWYVTTSLLNSERSQIRSVSSLQQTVDDLEDWVRAHPGQVRPEHRLELVDRHIEVLVGRMIAYRVVSIQQSGEMPTHESSCQTLFLSELAKRIARTGVRIAGLYGQASLPRFGRFGWSQQRRYLSTVLSTIVGGSSEIQRNVIATRGLGLPR
jgi:alkylation response protein AidB-like acyl-CoA dehydrogenase